MRAAEKRALPYFAASIALGAAGIAAGATRQFWVTIVCWLVAFPCWLRANSISEAWHWRAFIVSIRIVGLGAAIVSVGFLGWALGLWTMVVDQAPLSTSERLGDAVAAAATAAVALLLLRLRPFRPDLGDVSWFLDPFGARANSRAPRNWWTGDPVSGTSHGAA